MSALRLPPLFRSALLFLAVAGSSAVFACPAGQYEVCVGTCFCAPGSKEEMGEIYDNVSQMAASGLETWIVQARDTAAAGDVQPIPLNIRAQLDAYFDLQVLDAVHYKLGDDAELNAANSVLQNPDVNAVTLVDIIVFRRPEDALNNVALWAHELKHVQQYQQWGVRGFASRYARDYNAVEAPAYAFERQVARALKAGAAPAAPAR